MTTPTPDTIAPPQDRIERLADRVLAVGKSVAAQGDGRTFTVDAIYDEMSEISRQRLSDAIKTLKDARMRNDQPTGSRALWMRAIRRVAGDFRKDMEGLQQSIHRPSAAVGMRLHSIWTN